LSVRLKSPEYLLNKSPSNNSFERFTHLREQTVRSCRLSASPASAPAVPVSVPSGRSIQRSLRLQSACIYTLLPCGAPRVHSSGTRGSPRDDDASRVSRRLCPGVRESGIYRLHPDRPMFRDDEEKKRHRETSVAPALHPS